MTSSTRALCHVVMMSGGIGSWATAHDVVNRYGPDQVTLLFADTRVEHVDLYRFLADAATQLGVPVTTVADGRTPWEVFRDERMIGNTRIAPCSHLLKQAPCRTWLAAHTTADDTIVYVGIDWTEQHRLASIARHWSPWTVRAPLCEPPYQDKVDLINEARAMGLEPPALYAKGFPHNNCGGACVRAGIAQWAHLLAVDPERYAIEEAQENAMRAYLAKDVAILRDRRGGTTKPLPLTALRQRIETRAASIDHDDWAGCGCFTDTPVGAASWT